MWVYFRNLYYTFLEIWTSRHTDSRKSTKSDASTSGLTEVLTDFENSKFKNRNKKEWSLKVPLSPSDNVLKKGKKDIHFSLFFWTSLNFFREIKFVIWSTTLAVEGRDGLKTGRFKTETFGNLGISTQDVMKPWHFSTYHEKNHWKMRKISVEMWWFQNGKIVKFLSSKVDGFKTSWCQ